MNKRTLANATTSLNLSYLNPMQALDTSLFAVKVHRLGDPEPGIAAIPVDISENSEGAHRFHSLNDGRDDDLRFVVVRIRPDVQHFSHFMVAFKLTAEL